MKRLLFLIIIMISTSSFAQLLNFNEAPTPIPMWKPTSEWEKTISKNDDFNNNVKNNTNYFIRDGKKIRNVDVIGDMYLSPDFHKARIIDKVSGEVINVYLRYRIFDDTFEARKSTDDEATLFLERSNQYDIKYNNLHFVFINKLPVFINEANNGYVLVLSENEKISLCKRLSQKYIPGQKTNSPMESDKKARLINKENYFININNILIEVEPDKRNAYKAFPNHQKELKQFIKDHKLKFKESSKDEDLIKLVSYYKKL
ncbi:hypothetical protein [Mesonia algae]|nr:hypothetical protein [Mesonia algae]